MSMLQQESAQPHHHHNPPPSHRQNKRITVTGVPGPPSVASTGGVAGDGAAPQASVDCYTCRRRRVKCDRALPHCAKCERTKLECLGYKKPLVWNKGVASRGKMMGKTFPTPVDNEPVVSKRVPAPPATATTAPTSRAASVRGRTVSRDEEMAHGVDGSGRPGQRREGATAGPASHVLLARTAPTEMLLSLQTAINPTGSPFFHLNQESRFYMSYFEQRASSDFVMFDRHENNPYRNLLPMASHHPALLNAMIAVGARHHSNAFGHPEDKALPYKTLSLQLLRADVTRCMTTRGLTEPILAVVMLFLFFEALDSGMDTWKIHLRGARQLLQSVGGTAYLRTAEEKSLLRIMANHVTLIEIIGCTLSGPPFENASRASDGDAMQEDILTVLRDGDPYNFLGCPAKLLEIIYSITLLKARRESSPSPTSSTSNSTHCSPSFSPSSSTSSPESDTTYPGATLNTASTTPNTASYPASASPDPAFLVACNEIFTRIESFSAIDWINAQAAHVEAPVDDLYHHIEAYKHAARIYALESLFPESSSREGLAHSHIELRLHLSSIKPRSQLHKGAVWPVFVAGTGAETEEQKEWVRQQLKILFEVLPQVNIRNAGIVLEEMWRNEAHSTGNIAGGYTQGLGTTTACSGNGWRSGWRRQLESSKTHWLFI